MKKASITVFLTFIILVLISFVFTSVEGARLVAVSAQTEYLAEMAKNSFGANYYFPLFKEYGLFSVDGGFETVELSEEELTNLYNKYLVYFIEESDGNILDMENIAGELDHIGLLETDGVAGFQPQMKELVLYEGLELLLEELTQNSIFAGIDELGNVMKAQEGAVAAVTEISDELMEVISVIDGVATTKKGIKIHGGNVGVVSEFVKLFGIHDPGYMQGTYGNAKIYSAVSNAIIYPEHVGLVVKTCIEKALELKEKITTMKEEIADLEERKDILSAELAVEEDADLRTELETEISDVNADLNYLILELRKTELEYKVKVDEAESKYNLIRNIVERCIGCTEKALGTLPKLKKAQEKATAPVIDYETAVNMASDSSGELKESFSEEITQMRSYVGLENDVYNTNNIYAVLNHNLVPLQMLGMPVFDRENLQLMKHYTEKVIDVAKSMSYDGVRFEYGSIVSSANNGVDISKTLKSFFGDGLFNLLGVNSPSIRSITGEDLVSDGASEKGGSDLLSAFSEFMTFFEADPLSVVLQATSGITNRFVSEVYLTNHFGDYRDRERITKILYEREYVLFGNQQDSDNLYAYLVKLIACKAIFCFLAIMSNGARNAEATGLAYGIAGVTGIAPLIYITKYLIMTVWAVEEAIVEAACLLAGKRVPIFSVNGNVSIGELMLLSPSLVSAKVESYIGVAGGNYSNYLTLLSFFSLNPRKNARMLDLVQENMRYRFRDSFRVRNMVTSADMSVETCLSDKFNTGFFVQKAYYNSYKTNFCYK